MKNFIYYPGFEVRDPDWLKFALLYIEKLNPIIPFSGDDYLSELHHKLENYADLINIYRPDYSEGERATFEAIDQVEKILKNPERYGTIFNKPNILDFWRNPVQQKYTLFGEKYANPWEKFCLKNKLAKSSPEGMLIHKDLGLIYMTLLAQSIADKNPAKGSPITDYPNLDKYSIFTHSADRSTEGILNAAQSTIRLKLPLNLKELPIDKIIQHRNRPKFLERLAAFHTALDNFFEDLEGGFNADDFKDSLGNAWRDFSDEIVQIGTGVASFGFGVWLMFESPDIAHAEYLKEIFGGAALVTGSVVAVKNSWKHTRTNRLARRYLSDLTKIEG